MQNYNYYILFQENQFAGFGIQMLKDEPVLATRKIQQQKLQLVKGIPTKKQVTVNEKYISGYKQVPAEALPDGAIIITSEQHSDYLSALNSQLKDIKVVSNKITIVDKYTPEELAKREAETIRVKLISEAKDLLRLTDRFNFSPYMESLTELERTALSDLRAVWLSVTKGTIKVMPEIPEFVKKLLEL